MEKLKVGDVVRIKKYLTDEEKMLSPHFVPSMEQYRSKRAIITNVYLKSYGIDLDHNFYGWRREWFDETQPKECSAEYED